MYLGPVARQKNEIGMTMAPLKMIHHGALDLKAGFPDHERGDRKGQDDADQRGEAHVLAAGARDGDGRGDRERRAQRHQVAEQMPGADRIADDDRDADDHQRPGAASVAGRGRSFRKSQDSKAANMVVKARMKTRLAVEVLKTAVMKVIEPKP